MEKKYKVPPMILLENVLDFWYINITSFALWVIERHKWNSCQNFWAPRQLDFNAFNILAAVIILSKTLAKH